MWQEAPDKAFKNGTLKQRRQEAAFSLQTVNERNHNLGSAIFGIVSLRAVEAFMVYVVATSALVSFT